MSPDEGGNQRRKQKKGGGVGAYREDHDEEGVVPGADVEDDYKRLLLNVGVAWLDSHGDLPGLRLHPFVKVGEGEVDLLDGRPDLVDVDELLNGAKILGDSIEDLHRRNTSTSRKHTYTRE